MHVLAVDKNKKGITIFRLNLVSILTAIEMRVYFIKSMESQCAQKGINCLRTICSLRRTLKFIDILDSQRGQFCSDECPARAFNAARNEYN